MEFNFIKPKITNTNNSIVFYKGSTLLIHGEVCDKFAAKSYVDIGFTDDFKYVSIKKGSCFKVLPETSRKNSKKVCSRAISTKLLNSGIKMPAFFKVIEANNEQIIGELV